LIFVGYVLGALFPIYSQFPSYLGERFPTEVRATASAFCYHQGAIFGGLVHRFHGTDHLQGIHAACSALYADL
jgi:hypothetical protein